MTWCVADTGRYVPALPLTRPLHANKQGWGEPENYPSTSAHGRISTPNLVEFGKGGIVFTNAYAGYVSRSAADPVSFS